MAKNPVNHLQLITPTWPLPSIERVIDEIAPKKVSKVIDGVNRPKSRGRGRPTADKPTGLPEPLSEEQEESLHEQTLFEVGEAIRKARLARKMTMEMVYGAAGLERAFYGRIEHGKKGVTVFTLRKIARAMGMTMAQLLEGMGEDHDQLFT